MHARNALATLAIALVGTATAMPDHSADIALGQKVLADLSAKHQIVTDSPYEAALRRVGARIALAAGPTWFTERFFVVRGNAINAFSVPGGYVFVDEGLLRSVDDADELAAVLGHETAHLVLGHVDEKLREQSRRKAAGRAGHILGSVGSYFGYGQIETAANLSTSVAGYAFLNYTRQQEYAADQLGAAIAAKAGFNPWGSVWFQEEVEVLVGPGGFEQYVQHHPSVKDRIDRLRAYITSNPALFGRWHDLRPSATGLPEQ
ncbi:MAG: M48 family metalloprotease [Candidatus Tyrphobacter sp.]